MVDPIKVIKGLLGAEDDLAEFIRNGPSTGFPGYVRDGFRHRCDEFANLPPWARALSGVAGGSIGRFCEPYWNDRGFDGPVTEPPPFEGGQCDAVYVFNLESKGPDTEFSFVGSINGDGPIQSATKTQTGPFQFTFTVVGANNTSNSQTVNILNGGDARILPRVPFRLDGLPDDCGDPEPENPGLQPGPNPPPNPGPLPGPEPTDNPDPDNPIPFFPLPPFNDPVFGPQPVTGPSDSAPGADPTPQPTGDNSPGEPDAIGNPIGDGVAGDEGEDLDFGEPPMGKIWVGCLVEFSVNTAYGNIPNTGPENTVYPLTVGNISLRYGSLRGTSVQVRSRFTELFRPNTALEVTGVFVQTRPNTSAIVRPISVTVCKDVQCSGE